MTDRVRLMGSLGLLAAFAVLRFEPMGWAFAAVGIGLGVAWRRQPGCRLVACMLVAAPIPYWQPSMAAALALYAATGGSLRMQRGFVVPGWTLLCAGVTPFALVGWFWLMRPDLSDLDALYGALPIGRGALVVGALAFIAVNASLEEVIWRGILQPELSASGPASSAIVLQAASFGLHHAHGFPRGPIGVALVFIWALMLGALRHRSRGLLAPLLAHLVADAVIAVIVIGWVLGE